MKEIDVKSYSAGQVMEIEIVLNESGLSFFYSQHEPHNLSKVIVRSEGESVVDCIARIENFHGWLEQAIHQAWEMEQATR